MYLLRLSILIMHALCLKCIWSAAMDVSCRHFEDFPHVGFSIAIYKQACDFSWEKLNLIIETLKVKHVINVLHDPGPYMEDIMSEFAPQQDDGNVQQSKELAIMSMTNTLVVLFFGVQTAC